MKRVSATALPKRRGKTEGNRTEGKPRRRGGEEPNRGAPEGTEERTRDGDGTDQREPRQSRGRHTQPQDASNGSKNAQEEKATPKTTRRRKRQN